LGRVQPAALTRSAVVVSASFSDRAADGQQECLYNLQHLRRNNIPFHAQQSNRLFTTRRICRSCRRERRITSIADRVGQAKSAGVNVDRPAAAVPEAESPDCLSTTTLTPPKMLVASPDNANDGSRVSDARISG
jgi:hypothetical protein